MREGISMMVFGTLLLCFVIYVSIQWKWGILLEGDSILLQGLRQRRIPLDAISSLSIRKSPFRPAVAVVLEMRTGKPITLPVVNEGSLALYRAIRARLRPKAEQPLD